MKQKYLTKSAGAYNFSFIPTLRVVKSNFIITEKNKKSSLCSFEGGLYFFVRKHSSILKPTYIPESCTTLCSTHTIIITINTSRVGALTTIVSRSAATTRFLIISSTHRRTTTTSSESITIEQKT